MSKLRFTVDSALLKELGEKLVGKSYVALAELVKNSYDADANLVKLKFLPSKRRIIVADDGHGMTFKEFKDFWMRIGSPHKGAQRVSKNLKRLMTGSKGVGRLAVQYLADKLEISTVSDEHPKSKLVATVDWDKAVKAKDLTRATVDYRIERSKKGFKKGTQIVLKGLKHEWTEDDIEGLAREVWWLQPPFRNPLKDVEDPKLAFRIDFASQEEYMEAFNRQAKAILDIWHARIVGQNNKGRVVFSLEFVGEPPIKEEFEIEDCVVRNGNFEIRIYHLKYRQPSGISVGRAREYFSLFGGVHIYDGGFHMPYYGGTTSDWLKIEQDHSHRLSSSKLLPKEIQEAEMLTFLPTLSRIFGVVNVDTSNEPDLNILITRDRLQDSDAFNNLIDMVRWPIDYYANEEKKRNLELEELHVDIEELKIRSVEDVLESYRELVSEEVYQDLHEDIVEVTREIETQAQKVAKYVGLMGSLATAGISSLAYQHETKIQFAIVDDAIEKLDVIEEMIQKEEIRNELKSIRDSLTVWLEKAKSTNALFMYLMDTESIDIKKRYKAKSMLDEIRSQVHVLARDIPIEIDRVDEKLLFPKASAVEWSSIFQNVLINAFNAMVDSDVRLIDVNSRKNGPYREILVQDTGIGIDVENSEELFEPFMRKVIISPERRALGYGGTGLGLTIVRLVATSIGCKVAFVEPEGSFSTAFSLSWRERE